ncbi:hypothetical protein AAFF_G00134080 [Aldrovandia affinis]|uniref:Uncharacterized protein n=1 Tax=Aldrovandia affinis TaxID=143900 RepID=A0AAD7RQE5_9TELE|nr:hypothetical protein AAFF_G00134080 [Aldrovandia affinis]
MTLLRWCAVGAPSFLRAPESGQLPPRLTYGTCANSPRTKASVLSTSFEVTLGHSALAPAQHSPGSRDVYVDFEEVFTLQVHGRASDRRVEGVSCAPTVCELSTQERPPLPGPLSIHIQAQTGQMLTQSSARAEVFSGALTPRCLHRLGEARLMEGSVTWSVALPGSGPLCVLPLGGEKQAARCLLCPPANVAGPNAVGSAAPLSRDGLGGLGGNRTSNTDLGGHPNPAPHWGVCEAAFPHILLDCGNLSWPPLEPARSLARTRGLHRGPVFQAWPPQNLLSGAGGGGGGHGREESARI